MSSRRAQAIVETAWQAISSTVTAPLQLFPAVAEHVPGRIGKRLRQKIGTAGADRLQIKSVGPFKYVVCTHRAGTRVDTRDHHEPERLERVLSLLGPFFGRELLCIVGAGTGPLCVAGILLEGFQRVVATERDPLDFDLLNASLLINHLGDRVTTLHAHCSAPRQGVNDLASLAWLRAAPGQAAAGDRAVEPGTTVDQLAPWATPGSTLVWIGAQALHMDMFDGARAILRRGVPLVVGLRRPGVGDRCVFEGLGAALSTAPYTHCYRIGPRGFAQAIDLRQLDLLLRSAVLQDGSNDLLFF